MHSVFSRSQTRRTQYATWLAAFARNLSQFPSSLGQCCSNTDREAIKSNLGLVDIHNFILTENKDRSEHKNKNKDDKDKDKSIQLTIAPKPSIISIIPHESKLFQKLYASSCQRRFFGSRSRALFKVNCILLSLPFQPPKAKGCVWLVSCWNRTMPFSLLELFELFILFLHPLLCLVPSKSTWIIMIFQIVVIGRPVPCIFYCRTCFVENIFGRGFQGTGCIIPQGRMLAQGGRKRNRALLSRRASVSEAKIHSLK